MTAAFDHRLVRRQRGLCALSRRDALSVKAALAHLNGCYQDPGGNPDQPVAWGVLARANRRRRRSGQEEAA